VSRPDHVHNDDGDDDDTDKDDDDTDNDDEGDVFVSLGSCCCLSWITFKCKQQHYLLTYLLTY